MTYFVILTDPDGKQHAAKAWDREQALAAFGDLVNPELPKGARVRVMSELEWQKVAPR